MRSATGVLAVGAVALLAVGGCAFRGDTSIHVRNETDQTWYVAALREQDDVDSRWVIRVKPGADGFGISWNGGQDVAVSVLAEDCSPVGVFRRGEDDTWVVDAVPGLTAQVRGGGGFLEGRSEEGGVEDTEDCGGFLYR